MESGTLNCSKVDARERQQRVDSGNGLVTGSRRQLRLFESDRINPQSRCLPKPKTVAAPAMDFVPIVALVHPCIHIPNSRLLRRRHEMEANAKVTPTEARGIAKEA